MKADQSAATTPRISLCLWGALLIERDAQPIRLPTRKVQALLAYLVLHPEAHMREKLAALLWGDSPDEQARGSLCKALTLLRTHLVSACAHLAEKLLSACPHLTLLATSREALGIPGETT